VGCVLWTIVGILLVIILIPAAARSLPAVADLARRAAGAVGNTLVALAIVLLVVVVGRRFLPALARAWTLEGAVVLAGLGVVVGGGYLVARFLRGRSGAGRNARGGRR
jgi:hypothetical protein